MCSAALLRLSPEVLPIKQFRSGTCHFRVGVKAGFVLLIICSIAQTGMFTSFGTKAEQQEFVVSRTVPVASTFQGTGV